MRRPRVALVGLVTGLVLVIGPAAFWWAGIDPVWPGTDTAALGPAPQVPEASLPDPVPAPVVRAAPAPTAVPENPAPAAPAPPVRIEVPQAGVDAPVVATGVDRDGGMAVPHDIRTVGWYRFGAGPGAPAGSAVLAGHVDDRIQGLGAFHRLADLTAGSPVLVTLADGTTLRYRVDGVEHVAKPALPVGSLFARDGPPRIVLVTCGGDFDRATGGYTDNVVVTAEPGGGT